MLHKIYVEKGAVVWYDEKQKSCLFSAQICSGNRQGGGKREAQTNIIQEENKMKKYVCDVCGYIYDEAAGDPDNGIEPGTKWEDVPDDFVCPLCGVGKDEFSEVE